MTDVFLSYASQDRDRILPLVTALEARGLTVWWDREIAPGARFDASIETAIKDASCVVVVWTPNALRSDWVQNEAMDGLQRGILVPVIFDNIEMPLAFRRTQAVLFDSWPKGDAEEFKRLLNGIRTIVGNESPQGAASNDATLKGGDGTGNETPTFFSRRNIVLTAGGAAVVAGLALGLMIFNAPVPSSTTKLSPPAKASVARQDMPTEVAQHSRSSIAVLPLENLSNDDDQAFFVAGLHDAIITGLANISGLDVISRTSTLQFAGTRKSIPEIGQDLRVGTLVEGSVVKVGDKIRLNIQIIDAASDHHLSAEIFDRSMEDVLILYSEIAKLVAEKVAVSLTPDEERRLDTVSAIDPATYEAYLRGLYYVRQDTPESKSLGLAILKDAVAVSPDDALAWSGLALAWINVGHGPSAQVEALRNGKTAALRALKIDPYMAEAHAALAEAQMYYDWDWGAAKQSFDHALELNPSLADVHANLAWYHVLFRRWSEALSEIEQAHKLDPVNPVWASWVAWIAIESGDLAKAKVWTENARMIGPDHPVPYYVTGLFETERGNFEAAISAHERAGEISPEWAWGLPHALAKSGKTERALELLNVMSRVEHPDVWALAMGYTSVGDHDAALGWLETGYQNRRDWMPWTPANRALAPLLTDPRMIDLMTRMNLPDQSQG